MPKASRPRDALLLCVPLYENAVDPVDPLGVYEHYASRIRDPADEVDLALLAMVAGRTAQTDVGYVDRFEAHMDEFVALVSRDSPWGCQDLLKSALFLSVLLQGMCSARVEGGVAETRFYYEEMRLTAAITGNMPRAWDKVQIVGAGKKAARSLKTLNNSLLSHHHHDDDDDDDTHHHH